MKRLTAIGVAAAALGTGCRLAILYAVAPAAPSTLLGSAVPLLIGLAFAIVIDRRGRNVDDPLPERREPSGFVARAAFASFISATRWVLVVGVVSLPFGRGLFYPAFLLWAIRVFFFFLGQARRFDR